MLSDKKELVSHPLVQKPFNNVRPLVLESAHKWAEERPKIKEKTKLLEYEKYDYDV
jgi:hypothetical protein